MSNVIQAPGKTGKILVNQNNSHTSNKQHILSGNALKVEQSWADLIVIYNLNTIGYQWNAAYSNHKNKTDVPDQVVDCYYLLLS